MLTLRGKPGVRRGSEFGNLEIIEDGSVFIQDGKIVSVGSTRRLENLKEIRGALDIPVHNCLVMPGFVDPCIRLSLVAKDDKGRLKRRRLNSFHEASLALMRSCLQHGTLNAGIKASSGLDKLGADVALLRQLARMGNNPIVLTRIWHPASSFADMPSAQTLAGTLNTIAKRKLADCIELNTDSNANGLMALVSSMNPAEMMTSLHWQGDSDEKLAAALQSSLSSSIFCDEGLSSKGCKLLAESASIAVFKAGDALLDEKPRGSLRALADGGGAIALGSGYDAQSEPNYNMQLVLALAVRRLQLTIEEAIVATTINAAYALNCGEQVGSLEPGKRADVLVLNLSDYREIPRRLGVNHVAMAIREGTLVINRTRWRVGAA